MVIDYSENIICIKHLVKNMEKLLIEKDWDQASVDVVNAITELRIMKANIELLKENDGTPYQVKS